MTENHQDTTPEGVVRRLLDLLTRAESREQMDAIADLWAADGVGEFPFAVGTAPTRLDGREAVREYLAPSPLTFDVKDVPDLVFHHTTDPETVVVECTTVGRTVRTGQPYEMRYIAVITVRDGEIVHYRDYWSPVQAARAAGDLGGLLEVLRGEANHQPDQTDGTDVR